MAPIETWGSRPTATSCAKTQHEQPLYQHSLRNDAKMATNAIGVTSELEGALSRTSAERLALKSYSTQKVSRCGFLEFLSKNSAESSVPSDSEEGRSPFTHLAAPSAPTQGFMDYHDTPIEELIWIKANLGTKCFLATLTHLSTWLQITPLTQARGQEQAAHGCLF